MARSQRPILVLAIALALLPRVAVPVTTAQQRPKVPSGGNLPEPMFWIEEHYEIAKAYQRGDVDAALRLLSERTIREQSTVVAVIIRRMEDKLKATTRLVGPGQGGQVDASRRGPTETRGNPGPILALPARRMPRFDWTVPMMSVAGSLHMDAALQAYRRDDALSGQDVAEHIKMAEDLFGFYELHTGKPTGSRRWQLAIGLTAMADGRFSLAGTILDKACTTFAGDGPLHLACGSIHETIAMMPADISASLWQSRRPQLGPRLVPRLEDNPLAAIDESVVPVSTAKAVHEAQLKDAAREFELVLASDANDAEARLRLAHVRMLQGNDKAAARLLASLVARPPAEPRIAYLARIYLGQVRARDRQAQAAAQLFEEAIALVPSGQSAYIALASLTRAGGDQNQATAVLHRMMRAAASPDDPWVGYRFGQFWVPDALIAQLRKEAQPQ